MSSLSRLVKILKVFTLGQQPKSDMMDSMLLMYDDALKGGTQAVHADRTSRQRRLFAAEHRKVNVGFAKLIAIMPAMTRLQLAFGKSTRLASSPHNAPYVDAPDFVEALPDVARKLGAETVGFAEITPDLVFAEKSVPYRYAIVLARRMDNAKITTAPSVDCFVEVMDKYGVLGVIANKLANYIIEAGYDAVPSPALGGAVEYPSLAHRAGLGEYGRHGMLISPLNGACQRLGAVFTNIQLPSEAPNDHAWVCDFCATCGKCIRACPTGAILETPMPQPAGHATCVQHERCLPYFSKYYGCSVCIKACPFTTAGYEKIKRGFQKARKVEGVASL